jgi:excisionase family DNA binding protein
LHFGNRRATVFTGWINQAAPWVLPHGTGRPSLPQPAARRSQHVATPQGHAHFLHRENHVPAKRKKPQATTSPTPGAIVPRMLVVKDAATYLGIGPWAMRQLHWDNTVRGVFIGRRLLFDRAALDRYVDALLKEAA